MDEKIELAKAQMAELEFLISLYEQKKRDKDKENITLNLIIYSLTGLF